jgi:branched-chain amino acid aminotransferase/4-amino-4-deoxychorismate lyase
MFDKEFGVFETVRVESGKAVFPELHLERLVTSCKELSIPVPSSLSFEDFKLKVESSAKAPISLVRFTVYSDGTFSASSRGCELKNELTVFPFFAMRKVKTPLSHHKIIDIMASLYALKEANRRGFDEALLFDCNCFLCETCFANIFFVKDSVFFTPSLDTGCLPGTRRKLVIKILSDMGVPVFEGFYKREDLLSADEVFLTSARYDVVKVSRFGKKVYPKVEHSWTKRIKAVIDKLKNSNVNISAEI